MKLLLSLLALTVNFQILVMSISTLAINTDPVHNWCRVINIIGFTLNGCFITVQAYLGERNKETIRVVGTINCIILLVINLLWIFKII
jgi:hypothetical protein